MQFKKGYKHQLTEVYERQTNICPLRAIMTCFIALTTKGFLRIRKYYCWDGASGPAFDTRNVMEASLVHDSFYQLIRNEDLDYSYRKEVDQLFYDICRESGVSWFRAKYMYLAVRLFGGGAATGQTCFRHLLEKIWR